MKLTRKNGVLVGLVAVNAILVAVGIGRGDTRECDPDAGPCIGLVFDVGGLGDKSFNDAAYRGLMKAKQTVGAQVFYVEPGDGSDRESALRQFAAKDFALVIGVGFIFSDDIRKLATEFPGVNFACVDYSPGPGEVTPTNLAGLRFREHEGSFLVGALAGLESKTKKLGFIGGMDIPLIHKFDAGFEAGVKHVCPECQVMSAYAGTQPEAFADPVKGKELAMTQYGRGADIIFHAAGKTGTGVFNAARELGHRAIGVDSDQFADAPCCVMTSMIKNVDVVVYDTVVRVNAGEFEGGVREFGLAQDGVGFVYDDNNKSLVKKANVDRVNALREQIAAGEIEVPFK